MESQRQDLADEKDREKNQVCNGKMLFLNLQIGVTPVLPALTGLGIAALLVGFFFFLKASSALMFKESSLNNISVLFPNLKVSVWLK